MGNVPENMKYCLYNLVSTIKNGQKVKKAFIFQKNKKICEELLNILWDEGFILGYKLFTTTNTLKIYLKYKNTKPVITNIQIISKPSLRVYFSTKTLWKLYSSKNLIILSTTKGLKT